MESLDCQIRSYLGYTFSIRVWSDRAPVRRHSLTLMATRPAAQRPGSRISRVDGWDDFARRPTRTPSTWCQIATLAARLWAMRAIAEADAPDESLCQVTHVGRKTNGLPPDAVIYLISLMR